jgi:hypothetical protein
MNRIYQKWYNKLMKRRRRMNTNYECWFIWELW